MVISAVAQEQVPSQPACDASISSPCSAPSSLSLLLNFARIVSAAIRRHTHRNCAGGGRQHIFARRLHAAAGPQAAGCRSPASNSSSSGAAPRDGQGRERRRSRRRRSEHAAGAAAAGGHRYARSCCIAGSRAARARGPPHHRRASNLPTCQPANTGAVFPERYEELLQDKIGRLRQLFAGQQLPELEVHRSEPSHFRSRAEFRRAGWRVACVIACACTVQALPNSCTAAACRPLHEPPASITRNA